MNPERIAAILAIGVVAITLTFVTSTPRTVADNVVIPTSSSFHLVGDNDQASGTLRLKFNQAVPAGTVLDVDVRDDVVSERPEQKDARAKAGISASYVRNRDLLNPNKDFPFGDFGTFAAYDPSGADEHLVVGLRVSPFRFLYGTTAADGLLSNHRLGLGLSFYAPPDLFGHVFAHWGLGIGRLWSFDDRPEATVGYLSFSTKIF
jgi:hypothetical protein